LSAVNYVVRFYRWQHFLKRLGHVLPLRRHFLYYLSGFAFTVSPAKAGEAVRSLYLRNHGVSYAESIAAFFVERLLDMFSIVFLASLIAFDHPSYRPLVGLTLLLLVGILFGVSQAWVPSLLERLAAPRGPRLARLLQGVAALLRSSAKLLRPGPLALGLVAGLIAWGAEGVGLYMVGQGLHIEGSTTAFMGIYSVAVLAGSVAFFLPAGIGGMEFVMTALLKERGATLGTALIATLLCRLATLWFAVILGAAAATSIELSDRKPKSQLASE
jgi:uncharacterized membrane protein YbhN (UPF0104 family)